MILILLKINKNINYKTLYEQLCSYGTSAAIMILLPQIIHLTRITDSSATIVDNIFTNNMNNNIVSMYAF